MAWTYMLATRPGRRFLKWLYHHVLRRVRGDRVRYGRRRGESRHHQG
ncbi:MAG: hypothetical protein GX591_15180 [Planctomycetes bacterium]|nr:hypothetical protein [Planctomycetota bacterium]